MKKNLIFLFLPTIFLFACSSPEKTGRIESRDYPVKPVPFTDVKVTDRFWAPRIRINHDVTIPIAFSKSEETGRIANFRIAGGLEEGKFRSLYPFDDSDVFKNIEAASYSLQIFPDPVMNRYLDSLISYIVAAQEEDGYLYTNRTINPDSTHEMAGKERWINVEQSSHELYNVGHLYEAAVAHYQATGKRSLLDVAIKNANLIDSVFGWGKLEKTPGHQEIEIGLVKLYRLTGNQKYLDLAKFFLDRRGPGGDSYNQMHLKPIDQKEAVGHAVRAQYMYAAMADIAALTGDTNYLKAIDLLWEDVTMGKTYLTGGIGSVGGHEGFGPAYELPNLQAYCETCAAVANVLWNYRMFLLHGEAKYFDVLEKVLYNGLISGVSLQGDSFFYPNPLESAGNYSRKPWFGCACCPVNITRFIPSVPGYIYAVKDDAVFINLYMSNEARIKLAEKEVWIVQETSYPWDGTIKLAISPTNRTDIKLMLRIPGWAAGQAFPTDLYHFSRTPSDKPSLKVNGKDLPVEIRNGYAMIERSWKAGDSVELVLPMEIMKVYANPLVKADSGQVALQRGPLIYCAEQTDLEGHDPGHCMIGNATPLEFKFNPGILNGIGTLEGIAPKHDPESQSVADSGQIAFRAIPYYAWANRGKGKMRVWFPTDHQTNP